jgi:hypothetical protein
VAGGAFYCRRWQKRPIAHPEEAPAVAWWSCPELAKRGARDSGSQPAPLRRLPTHRRPYPLVYAPATVTANGMQVAGSARTSLNLTELAMANPRNYLMWAFLVVFLGVAVGCAPKPDRRAAGEFVDDATLTARVKTALLKEEGIKGAAEINVDTYRGVVSLSGFVDNETMIRNAVAAARRVEGVKDVINNLKVKPPR